jgi:hypothetical protein
LHNKFVCINGKDGTSRKDGKIIFPSDDIDNQSQKYIPKPLPICENSTFCESALNYPNDLLETALRMNKDLKFFSGIDLVRNFFKYVCSDFYIIMNNINIIFLK